MRTHHKFKGILLLLAMVIGLPVILMAQIYSEKREQGKSFKLKSGITVSITNKYGNINVMPWEKDSVRIEVSMSAQSKQAAKVVKILSSIDCEMISTATSINVRTVFYDNSATFWKDVVSYAGQVINTSNNLQINYTIYIPESVPIKLENKFGNIYMESHRASADITLSNGDLQARNFSKQCKLKLEFGSAIIQDIENAQFNINYSDLTCGNINTLALNSRSSTIEMEEIGSFEIVSSRDKLVAKTCYSLNGETSFSRIRINLLESACNLETKYGELKLNTVSRSFRTIQLKSEFTDIFMGINSGSAYSIDMRYDAKTNMNVSASINNHLKKESLNDKAATVQAIGNIGNASPAHISVYTKSGSISLLNK